ncbi:MAG: sterol desaturase/sphingolipid hydroxylase (fatty acid hydroxylase superfamily) [Candidatus Woesearchaeota archaeon]|jgi:sterol desaturase/sphingolipid hydroxylase (fatty acid hydroxylase superfamily)
MDPVILKRSVLIGVLVLFYLAEHLFPFYHRRKTLLHDTRNLFLGVINMVANTLLSVFIIVVVIDLSSGFGLLYHVSLPVWLSGLIAILLLDFYLYWWHRLNHVIPFFWKFHKVHHSDTQVDVTSSVRFHTVEVLLSGLFRIPVLILFGIGLGPLVVYELLFLPIVYFHHSNIKIPESVDRVLRWVIPSPHMHRVHHSKKMVETNSNYTSLFSFWDRIFGSYRLVKDPHLISQGIEEHRDDASQSVSGMLKTPFLKN